MKIEKYFLFILIFILVLYSFLAGQNLKTTYVGFVIDGPWSQTNEMLQSVKREILELTTGEFNVQFPADKTIQADWTIKGISTAIDQLLADRDVNMILTLGSISSNEVCHRNELSKPVIAPFVLDAEFQELPIKNGTTGIKNLNYISVPSAIKRDMEIFKEIISFKKLAILINKYLLEAFPGLEQRAKKFFRNLNIEVQVVGVGHSITQPLAQLSGDIEAVYVLSLLPLSDEQYKKLAEKLIAKKLPSFSFTGAKRVEQGLLAGLNLDVVNRLARRVALNSQRILLGEKPESIPIAISLKQQLTII